MLTSKLALLALLSALALIGLSAACAGGGDEDERVPIRRIDFTGAELSAADFFDPPFVDQYPEVVAEVNGEPITGEALAARQVMMELGRRQTVDIAFHLLQEQFLADIESTDPLEALIDDDLKRQAVERLGLLPSYEEAADFARKNEEMMGEALERTDPSERRTLEEALRLMGLSKQNWAADQEYVDRIRQGMGLATLRNTLCTAIPTPDQPTPGMLFAGAGRDCEEFLDEERQQASIRYFVKWVD